MAIVWVKMSTLGRYEKFSFSEKGNIFTFQKDHYGTFYYSDGAGNRFWSSVDKLVTRRIVVAATQLPLL